MLTPPAPDPAVLMQRAAHAQQLQHNPLLNTLLDELDAMSIRQWREGKDSAEREDAWWTQRAVAELRRHLQTAIDAATVQQRRAERRTRGYPGEGLD
jgi:hypothetical protein